MATEDLVYRNSPQQSQTALGTSPAPDKPANPTFLWTLSNIQQETISALGEANQQLNKLGFYDPEEQPPTDSTSPVEAVRPIVAEVDQQSRVIRALVWTLQRRLVQLG